LKKRQLFHCILRNKQLGSTEVGFSFSPLSRFPMIRRATNYWVSLKTAVLALGAIFVFCAPVKGQVCGSHDAEHMPTSVPRQKEWMPVLPTDGAPDFFTVVVQNISHRFESAWKFVVRVTPDSPCPRCPLGPASPGRRCDGPNCSGDPVPTALPLPTPTELDKDPVYFLGVRTIPLNERSVRLSEADTIHPFSCSLNAIFHPPRLA
jgi:hypothetical protein